MTSELRHRRHTVGTQDIFHPHRAHFDHRIGDLSSGGQRKETVTVQHQFNAVAHAITNLPHRLKPFIDVSLSQMMSALPSVNGIE